MFGGSFTEVKDFNNELKKTMDSELYILSTRYGILSANEPMIPYEPSKLSIEILKSIDLKNEFFKKINEIIQNADYLLLFLPRICVEYFNDKKFFNTFPSNLNIIIVTAKKFKKEISNNRIKILTRPGVARIGKINRKIIIEKLESVQ